MKLRISIVTPLLLSAVAVAAACGSAGDSNKIAKNPAQTYPPAGGNLPGTDPGGTGTNPIPPTPPPPPDAPPPPSTPATYVRGSLKTIYQLLPRGDYGRVEKAGKQFSDADYQTQQVTTSAGQKMDEIGAQMAREAGATTPVDLMPLPNDRQRSQFIPFRGKPSDVKVVHVAGQTKLYVPLGGDVMIVGNQVAVMSVNGNNINTITQIPVGVRPQRIAVHPTGLVFVCNQYSNYISVIDPRTDLPLQTGSTPVEVPTEYMCGDLTFTNLNPRAPDPNHQFLYVANRWRHSVLKYSVDVTLDSQNRPVGIQSAFVKEILGAGNNPWRLTVSDQQDALYVANNKGGEVARIQLSDDTVTGRVAINAPSNDVVQINNIAIVPTRTPYRGLMSLDDPPTPPQQAQAPISVKGMDGNQHIAHPGAMFDQTRSYNFQDLRNGIMQLDANLTTNVNNFYYTDDTSSEPNFTDAQKILAGAGPNGIARNKAGTLIWVAMGDSALVQEFHVNIGNAAQILTPSRVFQTRERPFSVTLDEQSNKLFVADWGGDVVEMVDLAANQGKVVATGDPGFAQPRYPATNVERGEFFFYDAHWSNNEDISCETCHVDELDVDGVGYSNGASGAGTYHQVKPNHNLTTTDAYFWNGSFGNGDYTSLAFGAQTRGNCFLIEFGFIDGIGSDPKKRVGDKNNLFNTNQVSQCRPISNGPSTIANQAQIDAINAQENAIADAKILKVSGVGRQELSRQIDAYSVGGIHIIPNPLRQMYDRTKAGGTPQLDSGTVAEIAKGKTVFDTAGCSGCHDPNNTRSPFADGKNHGRGADWTQQFINTYGNDPKILAIGGIPATMLDANSTSVADHDINYWPGIEFFVPFCFDAQNCVVFDDPLAVRGSKDEQRRLDLIIKFNLGDQDRGFMPGNVPGKVIVNTPSLRGVWTQPNLLHHGLAHSYREAILAPGHPLLQPGENGFAVDSGGNIDVHGVTSTITADDLKALIRFVESIE